jgi:hypothetical protein
MDLDLEPIEIMPLVQQTLKSNQAYADVFGVTFTITAAVPGTFVLANREMNHPILTLRSCFELILFPKVYSYKFIEYRI